MKTVVITGSTRGFGYALAKKFLLRHCNVVISGRDPEAVERMCSQLRSETKEQSVTGFACDVTDINSLKELWDFAVNRFIQVDIWINNAGINQPDEYLWELNQEEVDQLLDTNLKGTIYGSQVAMKQMSEQSFGFIYNVEGHGSNDSIIPKLSMYGTTKRAITYFTKALAKESARKGKNVKVGMIAPGIMITDFLTCPLGDCANEVALNEKTKKAYNILGDYPDKIANFVVERILAGDQKNGEEIQWLTKKKAAFRFLFAGVLKRNLV